MLAKAPGLGADMVFLDLEDAVAPLEKPAARAKVVEAINTLDFGESVLCVRVNAWDTEWTYRDVIEVVEGASERLDELMLPKVETAADVIALDHLLTQIEKVTGRQSRSASKRRSRPRGAHQRRGDLRRERPARDDHPRPGRHVGVDGDAVARPAGSTFPSTPATTSTTRS